MPKETPLLPNYYYHIYNRGNNGEDLFKACYKFMDQVPADVIK